MVVDYRAKIIEELSVLQKKEAQDRNVFKARAYGKVVSQLKASDEPVRSMEDLKGVEGIGEKIREKIEEIMRTGSLEVARAIKNDRGRTMQETLMNIYGVGPVKAKALLEKYPVQSLEEFRRLVDEQPAILNDKQRIGLKYFEDLMERIPRAEMMRHERAIAGGLKKVSKALHCDVVGSFRRGAADSGDIDVLIGYPAELPDKEARQGFKQYVEHLRTTGYITDVLALGAKKCMAVCRLGDGKARRLDLLLTSAEEYPYAILYFTGSDKFNIQFRKKALERGYTLNAHALTPVREGVPEVPLMADEKEIFAFLGMEYVPPEKRARL
jgi:DNA polymerase/3'-5' exonuclease PolX